MGGCPVCDDSGQDGPGDGRTFGTVVLDLMLAREMTQAELAWRMEDFSPASLSRLINGRRGASAKAVAMLAKALALDPHETELLLLAGGYASERTQARARAKLAARCSGGR